MLRDYQGEKYGDYSNCRDLQNNRIVMWQHKHYLALTLITNFGVPLLLGLIFNDILGFLITVGFLRLVLSHHFTFFINSLAHIWGSQPYTDKNTARDNGLLAFVTYGEGYHNYHHIFEADYRNGIRWYQYDPSKWFIKAASFVGLTKNLRKVPFERIQAAKWKMQKYKTETKVIELPHKQEILTRLEAEYDVLMARLKAFVNARKEYLMAKRQNAPKMTVVELKKRYQLLKAQLASQQSQWQQMLMQVA